MGKMRIRAFVVHLLCSLGLAFLAVLLVFGLWYPAPLSEAVGVASIFLTVLMVDVVLGPLLTLVVFKPGKPSLRFDLTCIVVVQLLAFSYGLWTVAEGRPAWLVFNVDRFDLVQAHELDDRDLASVSPEYRQAPWFGPRWVAALLPDDPQARSELTLEAVFAGLDAPQRPGLYVPLEQVTADLRKHARSLSELRLVNSAASVERALRKVPTATAWLPLMSRERQMVVLVDLNRLEKNAVVNLRPWRESSR